MLVCKRPKYGLGVDGRTSSALVRSYRRLEQSAAAMLNVSGSWWTGRALALRDFEVLRFPLPVALVAFRVLLRVAAAEVLLRRFAFPQIGSDPHSR
jgi:hypothetical protein